MTSTVRTVVWVVVVAIGLLIVAKAASALFVLFAGVLGAVFLETCARFVSRKTPIPYRVAVVGILVLLVATGVLLGALEGPKLADQIKQLATELPAAGRGLADRVRHVYGGSGELSPRAETVVEGAKGVASVSIEMLAAIVVIAFVSIYGSLGPRTYTRIAIAIVPVDRRVRALRIIHTMRHRLGRWLFGRIVAMTFVGVVTVIGLWILKIPLAFSLGILAGVATYVEYVGAVASAVPPLLLALGESPTKALGVIILFTLVHIAEGYILTPLVIRRAVRFPPAYTLAAQTLFGALFGVVGITFATPTCIVAATLVEMLWVQRIERAQGAPALRGKKDAEISHA